MKIYLVEDKPEEQQKAIMAVTEARHEHYALFEFQRKMSAGQNEFAFRCWSKLNGKVFKNKFVDGVITDLHFHASPWSQGSPPPAGLLIVIGAIQAGIPVVVCTNAEEAGGHHAESLSWIFDGYVGTFEKFWEGGAPFGWVEDKDWAKAVSLLERMVSKKAEADRSAS